MKRDLKTFEAIENLHNLLELTDPEWEDSINQEGPEVKLLVAVAKKVVFQATKMAMNTKDPIVITTILLLTLKEHVKNGYEATKNINKV